MEGVIVLSGPIGVGKSSFGRALVDRFGAIKVGTRDHILRRKGCQNERGALQDAGSALDEETGGTWVADCVQEAAASVGLNAVLLLEFGEDRAAGPSAEGALSRQGLPRPSARGNRRT